MTLIFCWWVFWGSLFYFSKASWGSLLQTTYVLRVQAVCVSQASKAHVEELKDNCC